MSSFRSMYLWHVAMVVVAVGSFVASGMLSAEPAQPVAAGASAGAAALPQAPVTPAGSKAGKGSGGNGNGGGQPGGGTGSWAISSGQTMASQCYQCHGPDGQSVSSIDSLADEGAAEIYEELMEMKYGNGMGIMDLQARGYTDDQIRLISDYLGTLGTSGGGGSGASSSTETYSSGAAFGGTGSDGESEED